MEVIEFIWNASKLGEWAERKLLKNPKQEFVKKNSLELKIAPGDLTKLQLGVAIHKFFSKLSHETVTKKSSKKEKWGVIKIPVFGRKQCR